MSPAALDDHIDKGIRRGKAYGMVMDSDYLRYLNLTVTFGGDFDQEPWASEILERREWSAPTRLDELYQRAYERLDAGGTEEPAEEPEEFDGLADEEPGESVDADTPEPAEFEPPNPEPEWDPDPDDIPEPEPIEVWEEAD